MADYQYDLIVLGTGGAGYQVATKMADYGWKVAAIDKGPFGGTCQTRGCIPKKVLAHAAKVADATRKQQELGIVETAPDYSWGNLVELKREFTDPVSDSTQESLKEAGVDVYQGEPEFVNQHTLEVEGQELTSRRFHIATGAKPRPLPIEGEEYLQISDDFLELDGLPESIIFVGGGYVSFEFAHIAARFGADVTILEAGARPLGLFDSEAVETVVAAGEEAGIQVITDAPVQKISKTDSGVEVATGSQSHQAAAVFHGAGRVPVVDELNLEAAGVEYTDRGVTINQQLQSVSNPQVTAAGDVADSGPPLTPVSGTEGGLVVQALQGEDVQLPGYQNVVSVAFTTPQVARVGLLESEAREQGLNIKVKAGDMSCWFDSKMSGANHAYFKSVVDRDTNQLLGLHVTSAHAAAVCNAFALAMEHGLTVEQIKEPLLAFPTPIDDARSMLP